MAIPDYCWPVDTTCVGWWDDEAYTDDDRALAVSLAGQTLRQLTGYRVGGCEVTVRPCAEVCAPRTWRGSGEWMTPVSRGGTWVNVACGHGATCGCPVSSVKLYGAGPGPVSEVKIDGAVLDPSAYRLAGSELVRVDGDVWPRSQDVTLADTESGTWSITYLPGIPVDAHGERAGGLLAGEFVKACAGEDCDLPGNVTQIVREGVTMQLDPDQAYPGGLTGITSVDLFVSRWNPHRLAAPSGIYSPDTIRMRHRVVR